MAKGKRKEKVTLVFDEVKRREFLTGFHKRKLQRKKDAKEKLALDLKEERKRLKKESKELYKKYVVSNRDIPKFEDVLQSENYEDDDVEVKVVELSSSELAQENNWIGPNQPKYESEEEEEEEQQDGEAEELPGMELKRKVVKKEKVKEENKKTFGTQKDFKRALKKQATKNVQKSKIFQKKSNIERQKQKKKSFKQKKERMKVQDKIAKKKGKGRFAKSASNSKS